MDGALIIFVFTLIAYVPLAAALLYIWWKYGKNEKGVKIARAVFLTGSALLFAYMMTL